MSNDKFTKHDGGKPKFSLLPKVALQQAIDAMMVGLEKNGYARDNWKKCDDPLQYFDAMMRHWFKHMSGEIIDPDSGKPHMGAFVADAMIYAELEHMRQGGVEEDEKKPAFEVGKFYINRGGDKAECVDINTFRVKPFRYPVLSDGRLGFGEDHPLDIIGPWVDEPVIHWDKIPEHVTEIRVKNLAGLEGQNCNFVFWDQKLDTAAFPTWRDHVGKTFPRPEGK